MVWYSDRVSVSALLRSQRSFSQKHEKKRYNGICIKRKSQPWCCALSHNPHQLNYQLWCLSIKHVLGYTTQNHLISSWMNPCCKSTPKTVPPFALHSQNHSRYWHQARCGHFKPCGQQQNSTLVSYAKDYSDTKSSNFFRNFGTASALIAITKPISL